MLRTIVKMIPAVVGGTVGKATAGKGLLGAGIGMVAARIASRSVPGAMLVGGALVAKYLYDKKKAELNPDVVAAVAARNAEIKLPAAKRVMSPSHSSGSARLPLSDGLNRGDQHRDVERQIVADRP